VICFASRKLSDREQRYCVTRRELLAVVYYLKYFKHYILGNHCLLRTDHSALLWLKRIKEPVGQQARWLEILEEFDNVTIQHRSGPSHGNADAMSSRPCDRQRCCKLTNESTISGSQPANKVFLQAPRPIECFSANPVAAAVTVDPDLGHHSILLKTNTSHIATEQRRDYELNQLIDWILTGQPPPDYVSLSWSADSKAILNQFERLTFNKEHALCRNFVTIGAEDSLQVIMPKSLRLSFLQQLHTAQGHLGKQRLLAAVRQRAYWPGWTAAGCQRLLQKLSPVCLFYKRKCTSPYTVTSDYTR
jgi:hypothetical protein